MSPPDSPLVADTLRYALCAARPSVNAEPARMGRTVSRTPAALTICACLGMMAPLPAPASERWFLMSRHGDCAPVATLKRKVPDLGEINDPVAFAAFMRRKGVAVTSTRVPVPKGKAEEVKVPERDLFLMFVTSEMCRGAAR